MFTSVSMGCQGRHQLLLPRLLFILLWCMPCLSLAQGTSAAGYGGPQWRPMPGKYLLAYCLYGRLTNQVHPKGTPPDP